MKRLLILIGVALGVTGAAVMDPPLQGAAAAAVADAPLQQVSQMITLPSLRLPPVTFNFNGQVVSIQQPDVPMPPIQILWPKQLPPVAGTNWVNVTNWVNATNWYNVTNVTVVMVTNVLPSYIPSLIVTGDVKFGSVLIHTNL